MTKISYQVLRTTYINNTHLNKGDKIELYPRVAQFLLADGTLQDPAVTKKQVK